MGLDDSRGKFKLNVRTKQCQSTSRGEEAAEKLLKEDCNACSRQR